MSREDVIVFRCNIDEATQYTNDWCKEVIAALRNAGLKVHDYAGTKASPRNFRKAISQHNPLTIIIFDHGSECDLYGEDQGYRAPLLGLHNAELTDGRVVVVLACSSAALLGPACVRDFGCLAYIGYQVRFTFYSIDPYLEGFKKAAIEVFLKLAEGKTLAQAHRSAKRVCNRILKSWANNPSDAYSPYARAAMMRNRDNHMLLGRNKSLTLTT